VSPAFRGLVAAGIAGGAQYLLAQEALVIGAIGYLLAAALFVGAMRPLMPEPFSHYGTQPGSIAAATTTGVHTLPLAERLAVLRRHWREFSIADLISGRLPPALAVREGKRATEAPVTPHTAGLRTLDVSFVDPQAVLVSSHGLVLVVDGDGTVFCFDPAGRLLRRASVADLPRPDGPRMAASPDGRALYVLDSSTRSLKVVTLS